MKNLLFIEPNPVLADTYERFFRKAGYRIACAATAQAGVDAADELQPDLAVVELRLVEHNGVAFLHEFRSYAEWQGIPVVVNSHVSPNMLATLEQPLRRDLGVVACLYKPRTTLRQLQETIERHVGAA